MKKVGVKTWSGGTNYGTNLQAYALKRHLECLGYSPTLFGVVCDNVNYIVHPTEFIKKIERKIKRICESKTQRKTKSLQRLRSREFEKQEKIFEDFCREELPKMQIRNRKQWELIAKSYDAFITGSDQVWNPQFFEDEYMLDFVHEKNIKKISYASSVGVVSISSAVQKKYKKLLKSYNAISVREASAVNVLQKISPVKIQVVLDPTMLLNKDEWDKFSYKACIKNEWNTNAPYILCYFVGEKKSYFDYVKKMEIATGFHVLVIAMGDNTLETGFDTLFDVGPREFVWLVAHASIVCTDSFHATVFSILQHREFYVLKRFDDNQKDSQNDRLYNLLDGFKLESRFIPNDQQEFKRDNIIDYDYVERILLQKRKKSNKFLTDAIEGKNNENM